MKKIILILFSVIFLYSCYSPKFKSITNNDDVVITGIESLSNINNNGKIYTKYYISVVHEKDINQFNNCWFIDTIGKYKIMDVINTDHVYDKELNNNNLYNLRVMNIYVGSGKELKNKCWYKIGLYNSAENIICSVWFVDDIGKYKMGQKIN